MKIPKMQISLEEIPNGKKDGSDRPKKKRYKI